MFRKWSKQTIVFGFLSVLIFTLLVALTVLAQTLSNQAVYLPLILAQYPPPPSGTTKLLITEVLYNPSVEPAGEWVEIYNPGAGVAILSAYKLGDEEKLGYDEGMLQFPPGAILDPGGVIVVANQAAVFRSAYGFSPDFEMRDSDPAIPDMLPYSGWSTGSKVELVNTGDEVLLLDGNDTIIDALSWGNSTWDQAFDPSPPTAEDGESLARSPTYKDSDSAADWVVAETPGPYQLDLSTPTPTLSPTPIIPTGPTVLLVSEVLYDPSGADPDGEWIEIYNAGDNNAALWLYRLGDEESRGGGEGMYTFPPGAVLLVGEAAIIARDALTFEILYGFKTDFEISGTDPLVPDMIKDSGWASGSLNLSLSGDEVLLLDEGEALVDGVSWGSSTAFLDPSVPKVGPDHSIERFPPGVDTDTAADWREQSSPIPGEVDHRTPTPSPTPIPTLTPTPLPDLIINEIHADPADGLAGDANGDGIQHLYDDEFLEIVNTTENNLDIGGWEIHDLTGVRHVFTDTIVIPAGCAIVIFGGGTPMGDFGGVIVQIASSGTLGLNNSGDSITLKDETGTDIDFYVYGSIAGDNQSVTRDPDITGEFVKHSEATASAGALFSPGTRLDGTHFAGCVE